VIGYLSAQDLHDEEAKVMQNYHQMSLKLLANVFATPKGRASMTDEEKARSLIEFCNKSFTSCNHKVAFHAALVLFNYLLAFETVNKRGVLPLLQHSVEAINNVLANAALEDKDTLVALLLCLCRLLFKNHELTVWVEDQYLETAMQQTMNGLKARAASLAPEVN